MSAVERNKGAAAERIVCPDCGREIHRTFIHPRIWVFGHAKGCPSPKAPSEESE